jgi:hypothetical protein
VPEQEVGGRPELGHAGVEGVADADEAVPAEDELVAEDEEGEDGEQPERVRPGCRGLQEDCPDDRAFT